MTPNKWINRRVTARFFGAASHFRSKEARCNAPVILALGGTKKWVDFVECTGSAIACC